MTRYLTNAQVEARAESCIGEFERRVGQIAEPPVPVERVIEEVFDLRILWEPIEAKGALAPLAGLRPAERRVVVNENRRESFESTPGLLEFTLGHEAGHWDLHVDKAALGHPTFDGFDAESAFRQFRSTGGDVRVLLGRLHKMGVSTQEAYEAVRELTRAEDDFFESRQADRYAATLLMPHDLVLRSVEGLDLLAWPALYGLRDRFRVSITALKIRLETMGFIYVTEDKRIHRSKAEALGQTSFL